MSAKQTNGRKKARSIKDQAVKAAKPVGRLRNYFLTGVVVIAPISLTIYLSWQFIAWVDDTIRPLIPVKYNPETYLPFGIPGLGVVVVFVFLTFVGFLTANLFGRTIIRIGERLLGRMPVIRSIYSALKQVFETVLQSKSQSFRQAVLIEYPRKGLTTIAFVTADTGGELKQKIGAEKDLVTVYVPTTPNPTSGFMLVVPREELVYLEMSVEDAVKMVISMGVIDPASSNKRGLTVIPADQRAKLRKKLEKRQANGHGHGHGHGNEPEPETETETEPARAPSARL